MRHIGEDPDQLPHTYAKLINDCIKGPPGQHDRVHAYLPRQLPQRLGRRGRLRSGGGDSVQRIQTRRFFLEYDSPRAGSFAPLRFVPKDKKIVLGLVTTKSGNMESADDLKRRIDEASRYVPLEQLALSPQCGFSSTVLGNNITVDAEIAKLSLVVRVAREVWG